MTNKIDEETVVYADEQALRRKNLKTILNKYFFSIASLADKVSISRANLSTLLSGTRPFSSYTANKIEASLALPHGYLSSNTVTDAEITNFLNVRYYEDIKYLVGASFEKKIKIPLEVAKQLKLNTSDDILITYMNDDLMYPTIKLNDMVFVDTNQNVVEDNKIYLFEVNGFYKIRRLIINKNSALIHIDNQEKKKTYIVSSFDMGDITIIGKIVGLISDLN